MHSLWVVAMDDIAQTSTAVRSISSADGKHNLPLPLPLCCCSGTHIHTPTPFYHPPSPRSLLGPHFHNRARISDEVMTKLMELPGTRGLGELRARAEDLTTWKLALQKG